MGRTPSNPTVPARRSSLQSPCSRSDTAVIPIRRTPTKHERTAARLAGSFDPVRRLPGREHRLGAPRAREAGETERAAEFVQRAMGAGSYDEVLQLCIEYIEVR